MQVQETDIQIKSDEELQDPDSTRSYDYYYHNGARVIRLTAEINDSSERRVIFLLSLRPNEQFILINAVSPSNSEEDLITVIYNSDGTKGICSWKELLDRFNITRPPDTQSKSRKRALVERGFPLFSDLPEQISFEVLVKAFLDQIEQRIFEVPTIEAVGPEP